MKTVIFTFLFFTLLLCFIFINFSYINKTSGRLCSLVQRLPDANDKMCISAVDRLTNEWKGCRNLIELSTSLSRLQQIDNLLSSLKVFAAKGRDAEYEQCRAHLANAFTEISEFESLNFFDIF
jgi:hypothetical protein